MGIAVMLADGHRRVRVSARDRGGSAVLIGSVEATIAVLFAIVVLGPILAERLRIPGIVGLIAGGMVFGPFVIDWLESDGLVDDLGSIGLLYLMFLAGLSFDIKAFNDNRRMAITFGLLGFFLPFLLSVFVVDQSDDIETLGALLIGAMWASNTLVAYSEVQSAGLQNTRSVGAAVSGGVVADLMSLTVLAFATATAVIEVDPLDVPFASEIAERLAPDGVQPTTPDPALSLWIGLPLLVFVCLWVLPRVANWFFVRVGRTRPQRFVFTLALMALGATVALLGGMEGLIGAFLAGLGLNRLVPARGPLMERLDFVGTSLFIPVFLISIGLNIDPAVLIDPKTIGLGLLFTGFVIVGKTTAALIAGKIFGLSVDEIGLMSSLSFGQAASTLAIAQVGLTLGMFGQNVVNAAVLTIVITAFITSYATRFFASRVPAVTADHPPIGQHVLLDTRGSRSEISALVAFAGGLARPDGGLVIPFGVVGDTPRSDVRSAVDRAAAEAAAVGLDGDGMVRVGDSFTRATVNLVAELDASLVLLAWDGPKWAVDYVFGNDIDAVGQASPVPTIAAHLIGPWDRIIVQFGQPRTAWQREDLELTADVVRHLRQGTDAGLVVLSDDESVVELLEHDGDRERRRERAIIVTERSDQDDVVSQVRPTDLVIVPAHIVHDMAPWRLRRLVRHLRDTNLAVVAGPHRLTISQGVTTRPLSMAGTPLVLDD
jgi:Kef-type K+ transport system membrane component KefB